MAELHELIEKIENPELRAQIAAAAKRALKHKQFGLVFEEHLPECTPLYDIPVRKGAKVSVRNGKANETYTVLKIEDGVATCLPKNSKEAVKLLRSKPAQKWTLKFTARSLYRNLSLSAGSWRRKF